MIIKKILNNNVIITLAEKTLGCKLNESIYIVLTDHIHMAVRRIRDGIIIRNMVLQETHKFYEKEFFGRATGFGNYERAIQSQHARRRNRLSCRAEFDKDSLAYYRFVTHLKFFAKRVLVGQQTKDEVEDEIYSVIKKKYSRAAQCAEKISALIEKKNRYKVSAEEKFYLTIHIAKVIAQ
ncbi:MAG: PRD domain-containing protein [Selenomonadaceae bacterium]|nr:PRD domain-containing protein [Selenomonadaceae bacterium]